MRIALLKVTLILGVSAVAGGCTTMTALVDRAMLCMKTQHDLAEIRSETREQLADQRREEAELQRQQIVMAARHRQMEQDLCRANQEALQQHVKSQIRDTVHSKVAFNVSQGLEVGELEVDQDALKLLLKDREQEPLRQPVQQGPKCNCDECECACGMGFLKKHCLRCRHKKCGCKPEKDCGGPETLRQLAREPRRRPLRPTEIPLKLPVRLTFGMQNPQIEEAQIRREPLVRYPVSQPCDDFPCDDHRWSGRSFQNSPTTFSAYRNSSDIRRGSTNGAPPAPPVPVPDEE